MLRHVALVRTDVTSQKKPFFIVTAMKTSNLTKSELKNGVLWDVTPWLL
jgi:hypothetical protein